MLTTLFDIPYLLQTYGYLGIFIIVFLESGIFFALPGDSLLFTAGLFASTHLLNIFYLVPVIFLGGFLGGLAGFEIGVNIERLRKYSFLKNILKDEHLNKAHEFFTKYGHLAVIFSRFVPLIRTFTPIVAGMAKMPYKMFLKYNLIGSLAWSMLVTLSGFFLGQIFPHIKDYMSLVVVLVVGLSVFPIILEMFRKKN